MVLCVGSIFSEEYNTIMRLDALYALRQHYVSVTSVCVRNRLGKGMRNGKECVSVRYAFAFTSVMRLRLRQAGMSN